MVQTNFVVLMTKEGSTKIVNFMTPGERVVLIGHGQCKSYSENELFSLKIFSALRQIKYIVMLLM